MGPTGGRFLLADVPFAELEAFMVIVQDAAGHTIAVSAFDAAF